MLNLKGIKKSDYLTFEIVNKFHNNERFILQHNYKSSFLYDSINNCIYQLKGHLRKIFKFEEKELFEIYVNSLSWNIVKTKYITIRKLLDKTPPPYIHYKDAKKLPTRIINLNPDSNCNLSCSYCFTNKEIKKSNLGLKEYYKLIDDFAYNYSNDYNNPVISFGMTSEPFLHIDLIDKLVTYVNEINEKTKKNIAFYYCTNGTILNDKIISILHKSLIPAAGETIKLIDISLDGPKEVHDFNRHNYNGNGSYDIIMENIEKLKEAGINYGFSCVLTKSFPYPAKILEHFLSLGPSRILIKPIRSGNISSFEKDDISELKSGYDIYFELIKKWIFNEEINYLKLVKNDFALRSLKAILSKRFNFLRCSMNSSTVNINENGDFYLCVSMMGIKEFKVGNISNGFDYDKLGVDLSTFSRQPCKLCWARYVCGGTCHYDGYKIKGNILDTYDVECMLKQYFLKKSVEILFSTIDKKGDLKFLKEIFCDD